MSHPVYTVPAGDVLPIFFNTFAGATGASVTMSGLVVGDIQIYKDASMTQAANSGIALIDTDGIDVDMTTGIHGFTIDTGDATNSSFYTVGAWFTVVVNAISVESQAVSFIAGQFRLVPAEASAGVPKVDVSHNAGTAITSAAGVQEVKVASLAANAITAAATATDFGTEVAAAVWATAVDGSYTATEMARIIMATLGGQATGLGTTTAVYKNAAGTKTRVTATVDADGNRSSVVFTDLT